VRTRVFNGVVGIFTGVGGGLAPRFDFSPMFELTFGGNGDLFFLTLICMFNVFTYL
jgi:hypothetical protein